MGITSFLNKVWELPEMIKGEEISSEHNVEINKLIKKVTEDIEALKLNTAIAAYMSFIKKIREDKFITREELKIFLTLLNPLAPHISSEIYEKVFNKNIVDANWPSYNEKVIQNEFINIVVNVDNKKKMIIKCPRGLTQDQLIDYLMLNEESQTLLKTINYTNVYFVQDKMINLITKGPNKLVRKLIK